jgi:DNA-binding beta-propeller fold protein YncE
MRKLIIATLLLCSVSVPALADLGTSILVADNSLGDVLKYDAISGAFQGVFVDLPSQQFAQELVYSPTGDLYLGIRLGAGGGKIQRYNGQTGAFLSEFNVAERIPFLTFGPNGDLFGSDFFGDKVHRYNSLSGAYLGEFVTSQSGGLNGPRGMIFGPDSNFYVSSRITGQVLRYNGTTGAFMDVFATSVPNGTQDVQFGPDGALWLANGGGGATGWLTRHDASTGALMSSWTVPGGSLDGMSMAFSPDNNYVLVSNGFSHTVRRLNATTGADLGDFVQESSGGLTYPIAIVYYPRIPEPATLSFLAMTLLLSYRLRRSS